jgi:hypothetical protein
MYRSCSLATGARQLTRNKLDLVVTQEVRWEKGGAVREGDYSLFCKRKRKSSIGKRFFVHYRILSAVKRVEIFRDRMTCIFLRGHWCNTNVSMCTHRVRIKVMIQNTVFMRN